MLSAATGALVIGAIEARAMPSGIFSWFAGVGFVMLAALPLLFAVMVTARIAWLGWKPTLDKLVDADGRAPRLAGWIAFLVVALAVLGIATYKLTVAVADTGDFRPITVGYLEPAVATIVALLLVALSRPFVEMASRVLRLRPKAIVTIVALAFTVSLIAAWWIVRPRLGPIDLHPLLAPVIGLAVAIALHVRFMRPRHTVSWTRRALVLATIGSVVCALAAWQLRPQLTLTAWGEMPIAGLVIDNVFDLEGIRDKMSIDAFRPVPRPAAAHPDIVVIIIDTVRADRTPPYGGPAKMPFLAELATRGTVFDWAFSPSNVTRRSVPSMLTGLSPNHVAGRVIGWALRIDPRNVILPERMAAAGYETAGFVCCDGFYGSAARTGLSRGIEHLEIEKNGTTLSQLARTWIEQRERFPHDRPLFLYMHILEPHNWAGSTDSPADVKVRHEMYDRSLQVSDRMIAEVVGAFHDRTPDRAPIVIVTADHGEALGEHDEPFHSTDLYNSQTHVPFVVVGPGIAAKRVAETVSLTDLSPTVVELAGYAPFPSDGESLAPLILGQRQPRDDGTAFSVMIKDRSNPGGVTSMVRGHWKLIMTGETRELFDISKDPGELTNQIAAQPRIAAELSALLQQHVVSTKPSPASNK
ncbi:MAG TPA: sulfatase-like hydrolase/transferase [Kofleriaceae bacterium]